MSSFVKRKKKLRPKVRSAVESDEIERLNARIAAGAPKAGGTQQDPDVPSELNYADREKFVDLPLSQYTKDALREANFETLTAIQRAAIPHALFGRDVLGAAKTGSGKTLAFLIPVLEKLYRERWNTMDGLGALIIAPTRELAMQIFGELRKVGKLHDFSAGLLIGGKDVKEEKHLVNGLNILVTTPGRLLQHMDETPGFHASNLKILVLDEADRCLDMGFASTLDAILDNLPRSRQVLLFSATQTKKVKDLKMRLHLDAPEYVSVHAEAVAPTPLKLKQFYMRCNLPEKLDFLWSFIRAHLKSKTLVFLSTCKQVRFVYEAFCKLRPGVSLRHLHGKMKQYKRMVIFNDFNEAKEGMVLFATDLAARGLDFPAVDWVIQVDCPENVATYIHRVGRTARLFSSGSSVLMLMPSEEQGMLAALSEARVPVRQLKVNPKKTQCIAPALQALLSKNKDMKELAQKAVGAYLRSVFLQPNKKVFDVAALPYQDFAQAVGLSSLPELKILQRQQRRQLKQGSDASTQLDLAPSLVTAREPTGPTNLISHEAASAAATRTGHSAMAHPSSAGGLRESRQAAGHLLLEEEVVRAPLGAGSPRDLVGSPLHDGDPACGPMPRMGECAEPLLQDGDIDEDGDDGFLVKKRRIDPKPQQVDFDEEAIAAPQKKRKKLKIRAGSGTGTRTVFGDDGLPGDPLAVLLEDVRHWGSETGPATKDDWFQQEAEALRRATPLDRSLKKEERARKKAEARARAASDGGTVTLACPRTNDGGVHDEPMDGVRRGLSSPPPTPKAVVDSAYLGMQPTAKSRGHGSLGGGSNTGGTGVLENASRPAGGRGALAMSLDEQEALVLRLLEK